MRERKRKGVNKTRLMNSIVNHWKVFKQTWFKKIQVTHLFEKFDNFIINELQYYCRGEEENKYNVVKKIYISNKAVKSVYYKKKTQALYIYQSPFFFILDGNKYECALFLENFLLDVIKFIEKNNTDVKIIRLHHHDEREEEEEEEEE